jgi:hypothetical protein
MAKKAPKSVSSNLRAYNRILRTLRPRVESFARDRVNDPDQYRFALKAAFMKSYELVVAATKKDPLKDFFVAAALRGVCEDFIAFKFLSTEHSSEKTKIVKLKVQEEIFKSSIAQWEFFKKSHPNQILYYHDDFQLELEKVQAELKGLLGIPVNKQHLTMPSVWYMAKKTNLTPLYKFLYHASSSLVHFNPHMLLRMGWGNLPEIEFSTSNFSIYYQHFALFYSLYLFREWIMFVNDEGLGFQFDPEADELAELLGKEKHWPELVTFEEMNIGVLHKILAFKAPAEGASD